MLARTATAKRTARASGWTRSCAQKPSTEPFSIACWVGSTTMYWRNQPCDAFCSHRVGTATAAARAAPDVAARCARVLQPRGGHGDVCGEGAAVRRGEPRPPPPQEWQHRQAGKERFLLGQ